MCVYFSFTTGVHSVLSSSFRIPFPGLFLVFSLLLSFPSYVSPRPSLLEFLSFLLPLISGIPFPPLQAVTALIEATVYCFSSRLWAVNSPDRDQTFHVVKQRDQKKMFQFPLTTKVFQHFFTFFLREYYRGFALWTTRNIDTAQAGDLEERPDKKKEGERRDERWGC